MSDTPEVKSLENEGHSLLRDALTELDKLAHFTEDELIALYEKLKGKL